MLLTITLLSLPFFKRRRLGPVHILNRALLRSQGCFQILPCQPSKLQPPFLQKIMVFPHLLLMPQLSYNGNDFVKGWLPLQTPAKKEFPECKEIHGKVYLEIPLLWFPRTSSSPMHPQNYGTRGSTYFSCSWKKRPDIFICLLQPSPPKTRVKDWVCPHWHPTTHWGRWNTVWNNKANLPVQWLGFCVCFSVV